MHAYAYRLHSSLGLTSVTLWNSLAAVAHLCIPDVNSDGLYFNPLITLRVRVHNMCICLTVVLVVRQGFQLILIILLLSVAQSACTDCVTGLWHASYSYSGITVGC